MCVMTGNVYFAGVDRHPFEDDMLIALMPVNLGNADEGGNGDGESFIAMSLSCDGVHFSSMTKLVGTIGREGRTWDHPVDGILMENGTAHFLMHNNVKGIGPNAPGPARILKYRFVTEELRRISEQARRDTIGCHPRHPSTPPPPPHPQAPPFGCLDDPTYEDVWSCDNWRGFECREGYPPTLVDPDRIERLIYACPQACVDVQAICHPPSPPPPTPPPSPPPPVSPPPPPSHPPANPPPSPPEPSPPPIPPTSPPPFNGMVVVDALLVSMLVGVWLAVMVVWLAVRSRWKRESKHGGHKSGGKPSRLREASGAMENGGVEASERVDEVAIGESRVVENDLD